MRLRELKQVKQLFVFPHMGDGGISVGSASHIADLFKEKIKPIENVYLGPSFSDKECLIEIKNSNVKFEKPSRFSRKVAELLNKGKVVGFFSGLMEFGPRALGSRSILVRATDPTINLSLNKRLFRTEFMPFAPITLGQYANESYKDWTKNDHVSYYMTCCYKTSKQLKKLSPAIVHIDGTARPQIVTKSINPELYFVLKEYHKLTGIPSLINTSFNLHEEPIVRTPKEAISLLMQDGIDVLAMPPFIVWRK
jgi:carbamoyltransferase